MVFLNALYFKSNWLRPFRYELTEKRSFFNLNNKEVTVLMMHKPKRKMLHGHIESLDARLIKLEYTVTN